MRKDRPSMTALGVARHRAAHQMLDKPLVFEDPLAMAILGPDSAIQLAAWHPLPEPRTSRYLRAFVSVRSRYSQDELALAVERGVQQCVILGAGLDTFAYRNPYPGLRVFEVDHPATQERKRAQLQSSGISIPDSLSFVPVDFERETFVDGLGRAGFRPKVPAFFSWLGVVPYLAVETTLETLRLIASLAPLNTLVFDYPEPRESLSEQHRAAFDRLTSRVAAAGEPLKGFFVPAELKAQLHGMGFDSLEDLHAEAINARFFAGRDDGLRVAGLAHLVCARR